MATHDSNKHTLQEPRIMFRKKFGFRKGYGTQDALAVLATDLQQTYINKSMCLCTFLDITSAYDDVIIEILCQQL